MAECDWEGHEISIYYCDTTNLSATGVKGGSMRQYVSFLNLDDQNFNFVFQRNCLKKKS